MGRGSLIVQVFFDRVEVKDGENNEEDVLSRTSIAFESNKARVGRSVDEFP